MLESVLSLHVLTAPKHHPLQHPWVRKARSIPAGLKREIAAFRFAYDRFVPEFLMPLPSSPFHGFDEELRQLTEYDDATLAFGFLRPLWDHGGRRDERVLTDPRVRDEVDRRVGELGADQELARLIFESPGELARRFADLLAAYWEAVFAEEWQSLEPALASTVEEAGRQIAAEGLYSYLARLSPQLLIDASERELRRDLPHEHAVEVGPQAELVLVPSVFVWPHVRINCDPPWPPAIVYPAPFALAGGKSPLPSEDVVHVLRALADPTRLRIAQADRRGRALDPGAGAADRDQRGGSLEASPLARPRRARAPAARGLLRALQRRPRPRGDPLRRGTRVPRRASARSGVASS